MPTSLLFARARHAGGFGLSVGLILAGCSSGGDGGQDPTCSVVSVILAPGQVTLSIGGQGAAITATLSTADCPVPPSVSWTSANPAAVSIGGNGTGTAVSITAVGPSETPVTITATAGGKSGTMQVTVQSPAAIALSATTVGFVAPSGGANPPDRTVTVSNPGTGTLAGLAVGTITYQNGAGWLQATLSSPSATPTSTLTLRVAAAGLPAGAYRATVPISSTTPGVTSQSVTIQFIVAVAAVGAPMIAFERWNGAAYPADNGEIWRMAPDGTGQTQLTNDGTFDGYAVIAPDRTRITFTTIRNGNYDIYLMNADGTGQTGLRTSANPEVGSSWSPDGFRLVHEWFFSGADVDLHLLTLNGATSEILVETPQSEEMPTWSPDGERIAFAKDPGGQGLYAIYRISIAGTDLVRLTNDGSDNFTPSWSPDGTRIAWSSNRSGSYQIWVMDALTGGNAVQLTTTGVNIQPTWSPDGTRIAWASGQNNDWDVWVMNADGSGKVNVTNTPVTNEAGPNWR